MSFVPEGGAARSGVVEMGVSFVIILVHSSTIGLATRMFLFGPLCVGVTELSSSLVLREPKVS